MKWLKHAREHHIDAKRRHDYLADASKNVPGGRSIELAAILSALLALVALGFRGVVELIRIRRALEARTSNTVARFNLTGTLYNQERTPMPAGPFTPAEGQGVALVIAPVNAAGSPVSGPFEWKASDSAQIDSITPAADGLSAKVKTITGPFDVVISVIQTATGRSDTAAISRAPVDNAVENFNLSGTIEAN